MARPRYRPKLPDSLQSAQHDAYVAKIASQAAQGGLMEAAGVEGVPERSGASGSWVSIAVGSVVVAVIVLVLGMLFDA